MKTKTRKYPVHYMVRIKDADGEWTDIIGGYDPNEFGSVLKYVADRQGSEFPFVIVAIQTKEVVYFDNE